MKLFKKVQGFLLVGVLVLSNSAYANTVDMMQENEVSTQLFDNVSVASSNSSASISDLKISEFITKARQVQAEEAEAYAVNEEAEDQGFLYYYYDTDENVKYVYENINGQEGVAFEEMSQDEVRAFEENINEDEIATLNANNSSMDGIGCRVIFNANGKTYISGIFQLPAAGAVTIKKGVGFIYAGISSPSQADMGLQYSNSVGGTGEEGWKPAFLVDGKMITANVSDGYYGSGYDQVTYKNGYKPGENIDFYAYSNYNGTGYLRLKMMGYATHATSAGSGTNTYLTTIVEYKKSITATQFKALATIGEDSDAASGSFTATISNITVGGSTPTVVSTTEDGSTIKTNTVGKSYTFGVGK